MLIERHFNPMMAYEKEALEKADKSLGESIKRMEVWKTAITLELGKIEHCRHLIHSALNHQYLKDSED